MKKQPFAPPRKYQSTTKEPVIHAGHIAFVGVVLVVIVALIIFL